MPDNLDALLDRARRAYEQGDKRTGDNLMEEILGKDFTNPEAWELLHQRYGSKLKFEQFQRAFTKKYYPDKLPLLTTSQRSEQRTAARKEADEAPGAPSQEFSLGRWFGEIFSRFTRPAQEPSKAEPETQKDVIAASDRDESTKPVKQPRRTEARPATRQSLLQKAAQQPAQPAAPAPSPPRPQSGYAAPVMPAAYTPADAEDKITVLIVDDIAQTRENLSRLLSFQTNIEIVGAAADGTSGIQLARETRPDVVLMDVNMPDMDGITATSGIRRVVPTAQVVILTVQDDVDYMRKAMMAGARDFLTKPPMIDELVSAVLRAGAIARKEKAKAPVMPGISTRTDSGARGKVVSVYSPKGGTGCTTLLSNLAIALHNEETRVALVDGDLEYGDLMVFFNEQSKNSVLDLALRADELDPEIIEEVMTTHDSGIKLLGAPKPEQAEDVNPEQFSKLVHYLRKMHAYVLVDTSNRLNDLTLATFDASDIVILLTTQDIPSIDKVRRFLDLAPRIKLDPKRVLLVMNQYDKRINISPEKVSQSFQKKMAAVIPMDSRLVQPSINRGVPFLISKDNLSNPVAKEILTLAGAVRKRAAEIEEESLGAEAARVMRR